MGCGATTPAMADTVVVGSAKKSTKKNIEDELEEFDSDIETEGETEGESDDESEETNESEDEKTDDSMEEGKHGKEEEEATLEGEEHVKHEDDVHSEVKEFARKYGPKGQTSIIDQNQFYVSCNVYISKLQKKNADYAIRIMRPDDDEVELCCTQEKLTYSGTEIRFDSNTYVPFLMEKGQKVTFEVYRVTRKKYKNKVKPNSDNLVGVAYYTVKDIRSLAKRAILGGRNNRKKMGDIRITTGDLRVIKTFQRKIKMEEVKVLQLCVRGISLASCDFGGKSDPYFKVFKYGIFDGMECMYQSEIHKKTLNPFWNEYSLVVDQMGAGKRMRKLRFVCFDWNRIGSDDLIGSFDFYPNDLCEDADFILTLKGGVDGKAKLKGKKGKDYGNRGKILVTHLSESFEMRRVGKATPKEMNIEQLLNDTGYIKMREYDTSPFQMVEVWCKFKDVQKKKKKQESLGFKTRSMLNLKDGLKFSVKKKGLHEKLADVKSGKEKAGMPSIKKKKKEWMDISKLAGKKILVTTEYVYDERGRPRKVRKLTTEDGEPINAFQFAGMFQQSMHNVGSEGTFATVRDIIAQSGSPKRTKHDKDGFILLVCSWSKLGVLDDQVPDMCEFSLPLDLEAVCKWVKLEEVWFHEVHSSVASFLENPNEKFYVARNKVHHRDLSSEKVYYVSGNTYDQSDKSSIFYHELFDRARSPESPIIGNINDIFQNGVSIEQKFRILTGLNGRDAIFRLEESCGDLKKALVAYCNRKKELLIPEEAKRIVDIDSRRTLLKRLYGKKIVFQQEVDLNLNVSKSIIDENGCMRYPIETLLLVASREGQMKKLAVLLKFDWIDFTFCCDGGRNVFHYASNKKKKRVCEMLFSQLPKEVIKKIVMKKDVNQITPLRAAVMNENFDCVRLLISFCKENGVKFVHNRNKALLLSIAAQNDSTELVRELLTIEDIPFKARTFYPPLVFGCYSRNLEVCKMIIDRNPESVNEKSVEKSSYQEPPLMFAVMQSGGEVTLIRYLLERGADVDHRSEDGETALVRALQCKYSLIAISLLKAGADPNAQSNEMKVVGQFMIDFVMENELPRKEELMTLMMNKGANLTTVYLNLVKKGRTSGVRNILLQNERSRRRKKSIDICSTTNGLWKHSALHVAIQKRYFELAKLLVEQKNVKLLNQPDFFGRTPGHYFHIYKSDSVTKWDELYVTMRENGLDESIRDFMGVSVKNYFKDLDFIDSWRSAPTQFHSVIGEYPENLERFFILKNNPGGGNYIRDVHTLQNEIKNVTRKEKKDSQVILGCKEIQCQQFQIPDIRWGDGKKALQMAEYLSLSPTTGFNLYVSYGEPEATAILNPTLDHGCGFYKHLVVMKMLYQTALLLSLLHRHGVVHRNIRPSSVLCDTDFNVRLTSFGRSCVLDCIKEDDDYLDPSIIRYGITSIGNQFNDVFGYSQLLARCLHGSTFKYRLGKPPVFKTHSFFQPVLQIAGEVVFNSRRVSMIDFVEVTEKALMELLEEYLKSKCCQIPPHHKDLRERYEKLVTRGKETFLKTHHFVPIDRNIETVQKIDFKNGRVCIFPFLRQRITDESFGGEDLLKSLEKYIADRLVEKKTDVILDDRIFMMLNNLLNVSKRKVNLMNPLFDILRMLSLSDGHTLLTRMSFLLDNVFQILEKQLKEMLTKAKFRALCLISNLLNSTDGIAYVYKRIKVVLALVEDCLLRDGDFVGNRRNAKIFVAVGCATVRNLSICYHIVKKTPLFLCSILVDIIVDKRGLDSLKSKTTIRAVTESLYNCLRFCNDCSTRVKTYIVSQIGGNSSSSMVVLLKKLIDSGIDTELIVSLACLLLTKKEYFMVKKMFSF